MLRKIFRYRSQAWKSAVESGKVIYEGKADEKSNLTKDRSFRNAIWSGTVDAFRTLEGDIFAWWEDDMGFAKDNGARRKNSEIVSLIREQSCAMARKDEIAQMRRKAGVAADGLDTEERKLDRRLEEIRIQLDLNKVKRKK